MELAKQTNYFESDEMNGAGLALRNILSASVVQLKEPFLESKESSPDIEGSESSGDSEEPEEEMVEDFKDNEDQRDDEDFIVLGAPKGKRKGERRVTKSSSKQSSSKKRKCEFCGTVETPMWRRGPTGKGTLCNACGVKWSLKFRKRAGKKSNRTHTEQPREQRHSTRKKIPTTKALPSIESKEELSPPQESFGFTFSHSNRKRLHEEEAVKPEATPKKRRENSLGSGDEDSSSDSNYAESHLLLGRLLNVVEHQIIEEREIDLMRRQVNELRGELYSREKKRIKLLEDTSAQSLNDLLELKRGIMEVTSPDADNSQVKIVETGSQIVADFIANIKEQVNEIVLSLGNTATNGLGKKFDHLQNDIFDLQKKMDANFSAIRNKVANDTLQLKTILSTKEASIRGGLVSLQKISEEEFHEINQKLERMEEAL